MSLKEKLINKFFGEAIRREAEKRSNQRITFLDDLSEADSVMLAKTLFAGSAKQQIEKSSKQIVSHLGGSLPSEGIRPDIDFTIFYEMFEQTSWVRAVVGVICRAVTATDYSIVPTKPNADPKNAEILNKFFEDVNPNDTFLDILDDITRDVHVTGNAFMEIGYGGDGKPAQLWNLDVTSTRVKGDDHGGVIGYVQTPRFASTRGASKVEFETNEVIHFKLGTKGATLYGLSPLVSLILPISIFKFAQIYNRAFFNNGAKVRGAFFMKDASPEQVERNREYLRERAKKLDLAQSDLVLEGGMDYKPIGLAQKDMDFEKLFEDIRNQILSVFHVSPGIAGLIETGNIGAGSGEFQTQTFYDWTVIPFQKRVAEKITKHVIRKGFGITDWKFQFDKRQLDETTLANILAVYMQNGVVTPDEVRRIVTSQLPEFKMSINKGEFMKGKLKPSQTIVDATRTVIALENRFANGMERLFREIKDLISSQLPSIVNKPKDPTIKNIPIPFETYPEPYHDIVFKKFKIPEVAKGIDDLEVILELIDKEGIAQVVERFQLDTARLAARTSARRAKLDGISDISRELKELLRLNSLDLASHISDSVKGSIRESLIEGLANEETVQQLTSRLESQLKSIATETIKPTTDAQGNLLREGFDRHVSRRSAAERIARTEANRSYNQASLDAYNQGGVEKVSFILSPNACEECRKASSSLPGEKVGAIFTISEAQEIIPVHPNCRCTWAPEVI